MYVVDTTLTPEALGISPCDDPLMGKLERLLVVFNRGKDLAMPGKLPCRRRIRSISSIPSSLDIGFSSHMISGNDDWFWDKMRLGGKGSDIRRAKLIFLHLPTTVNMS